MSNELKIKYDWLGGKNGFYADLGIGVGDDWLTQLHDLEAKTVRETMRGCAYRLALWMATNWWRLRWEPERSTARNDVDWLIAHCMASAGGGYVWPNILFASEGDSIALSINQTQRTTIEPIAYLSKINTRISAKEFETKIDAFINSVMSRVQSLKTEDETLECLWKDVVEERMDKELTQWRKLEALCGYDPDESPKGEIESLINNQDRFGKNAIEEIAAEGKTAPNSILNSIIEVAGSAKGKPKSGGYRGKIPKLHTKPKFNLDDRPWQKGAKLAEAARKEWGLSTGPINNKQLADCLRIKHTAFTESTKKTLPLPIAIKTSESDSFDIYFKSSIEENRRFAAARLLGDYLYEANKDCLIPATSAKTARQQFQRAFAGEFLCPYVELRELKLDEEDLGKVAQDYKVSPMVILTTFKNKGEISRNVSNWAE